MNRGPEIGKVTFSYEPQNSEELALSVGELVTITEKYDNGWCKGEKNGKIGIFPYNYVEPASPSEVSAYNSASTTSSNEIVIAIQDFQGSSSQLSFKKDDVINVLEKFPTGWWKGELNGRTGVFPRSAVRLESEAPPDDRKSRRNTVNLSNGSYSNAPPVPDRKRASTMLSNGNVNAIGVGKALYSYKGTGPGQLSFNKNDTIKILERKESGWWRGELNGQSGVFPSNYIETAEEDSDEEDEVQYDNNSGMSATLEEVIALYPYKASGPGQLSFGKDERIQVIEKTESGWWRGDLRGTVGLFPSNYVKVVSSSQPGSALNTNNPYEDEDDGEGEEEVTGQKPVARARALYEYQATTSHELSLYPEQVINVFSKLDNGWWQGEVEGRIGHFPSTYVEEIPLEEPSTTNSDFLKRTQSGVPQVATEVSAGQGQKARALYAYKGKTDRELSFAQGEEVTVLKKFDNGWWQGEYKGKIGHFPGNYVKEISADSAADTAPPTNTAVPQSPSTPKRGAPNKPIPPVPPRTNLPKKTTPAPTVVEATPTPSTTNNDPSPPPVPNRRSMNVAPPRPAPPSSDTYNSDVNAAKKQQAGLGILRAPSMSVNNKYEAERLANAGNATSSTPSTSSGGVSLESIKKALITLQSQTKTAVDGMLKRLDAQNKERSKLEFVMRDMKRCLKEEQQHRELLQSDIKILQSQYRAANGAKPDLNQLPTPELVNHVGLLNNKLDLEVKARKELQATVTKLQSEVDQLTRKLQQLN